jgi:predicted protein tyrosine phosphatase
MNIHAWSRYDIETKPLPGPSALICMADSPDQFAALRDRARVIARLDLVFNDATERFQFVSPPSARHAQRILRFVKEHENVPHIVSQCQVGVGRSQAVQAALVKIAGADPRPILRGGTYNRSLYKKLLVAAGRPPEPEPLVSITIRIKYGPDRFVAFIMSMRRQRYENWELVAVTDGPNPEAVDVLRQMKDRRVKLVETPRPLGRWGHPYRQLGLDACRGEFIGMSNDDNYYVPGYIEQMVNALEDADLAMCSYLHSYFGWRVWKPGTDLGAWLARASLVKKVPWTGQEHTSDQEYVVALKNLAKGRVATVNRPLFVHN